MANNTLITHGDCLLTTEHQNGDANWWLPPFCVVKKSRGSLVFCWGPFNVPELHVGVKLPLRRWQRLKGGETVALASASKPSLNLSCLCSRGDEHNTGEQTQIYVSLAIASLLQ